MLLADTEKLMTPPLFAVKVALALGDVIVTVGGGGFVAVGAGGGGLLCGVAVGEAGGGVLAQGERWRLMGTFALTLWL